MFQEHNGTINNLKSRKYVISEKRKHTISVLDIVKAHFVTKTKKKISSFRFL